MMFSNRAIQAGSSLFTHARGRVEKGIQQTKTWLNKPVGGNEDDEMYAHFSRMKNDKKYRDQVKRNIRDADFSDMGDM